MKELESLDKYVKEPITEALSAPASALAQASQKILHGVVVDSGMSDYVRFEASRYVIENISQNHPFLAMLILGMLSELPSRTALSSAGSAV